jgi:hypothetical protein
MLALTLVLYNLLIVSTYRSSHRHYTSPHHPALEESLSRFERHFGWQLKSEADRDRKKGFLAKGLNTNEHPTLSKSDPAYAACAKANALDMQLYAYATDLFDAQGMVFNGVNAEHEVQLPPQSAALRREKWRGAESHSRNKLLFP